MRLVFSIPGRPVPKKRPRVVRRGGRAIAFTPRETVAYERHCGWCARAVVPANWDASGRYAVSLRVYGAHHSADLDNIAKSVLDGCEGILWANDKRVTKLSVERCAGGEPRVDVEVTQL